MSKFRHPFAYWIMGYQKFIEPLVRASLTMKLNPDGYSSLPTSCIGKNDLNKIVAALSTGNLYPNLTQTECQVFQEQIGKRHRLQLDFAFSNGNSLVIGEIKSWEGYSNFSEKIAYNTFSAGPNAFLFLLRNAHSLPVEKVMLVVWGEPLSDDSTITERLSDRFSIPIQLEYSKTLIREYWAV